VRGIRPAALSVGLTAVLVGCAYAGTPYLAAAVLVGVAALAFGWGRLLALAQPVGSGVVVAGSGVAGVVAAVVSPGRQTPLKPFTVILALSVLAAFGHELLRRDGRPRLVYSLTGTFAGQVVAVLGAGWLLLAGGRTGVDGVVVAGVAVIAARVMTAVPLPLRITGWLALVAGASFSAVAAGLLPRVTLWPGAAIGAVVGVAVAAIDRLLTQRPQAGRRAAMLAAASAPVLVAGLAAYCAALIF